MVGRGYGGVSPSDALAYAGFCVSEGLHAGRRQATAKNEAFLGNERRQAALNRAGVHSEGEERGRSTRFALTCALIDVRFRCGSLPDVREKTILAIVLSATFGNRAGTSPSPNRRSEPPLSES